MAYNIINKISNTKNIKKEIKMKNLLDRINRVFELEEEEMVTALEILEVEMKETYSKAELEKLRDIESEIPSDAELILMGIIENILK